MGEKCHFLLLQTGQNFPDHSIIIKFLYIHIKKVLKKKKLYLHKVSLLPQCEGNVVFAVQSSNVSLPTAR